MVLCDKRCLDLSLVCSHPDFPFIIRTIPVLFPMDLTEGGDALQEGHRAQSRVDGTIQEELGITQDPDFLQTFYFCSIPNRF